MTDPLEVATPRAPTSAPGTVHAGPAEHPPGHGGWRRGVVGLALGAGFGLLVRWLLGPGDGGGPRGAGT